MGSAVDEGDRTAGRARRNAGGPALADFARSITLVEAVGQIETKLAETLRAVAAEDRTVAARRLRLAEDATQGAQAAARTSERPQQQARQWAEHADVAALRQALDHAAAAGGLDRCWQRE